MNTGSNGGPDTGSLVLFLGPLPSSYSKLRKKSPHASRPRKGKGTILKYARVFSS